MCVAVITLPPPNIDGIFLVLRILDDKISSFKMNCSVSVYKCFKLLSLRRDSSSNKIALVEIPTVD